MYETVKQWMDASLTLALTNTEASDKRRPWPDMPQERWDLYASAAIREAVSFFQSVLDEHLLAVGEHILAQEEYTLALDEFLVAKKELARFFEIFLFGDHDPALKVELMASETKLRKTNARRRKTAAKRKKSGAQLQEFRDEVLSIMRRELNPR